MRRTTVFYFRTCTLSNTTEKNFVGESSLDNNFNPCTGVLFTSLDTLEKQKQEQKLEKIYDVSNTLNF